MANQSGKLKAASAAYRAAGNKGPGAAPGAGPEVSPETDSSLMEKSHDRNYNPINDAKRGSIGAELNQDAARYKKGPGPL